MYLLLANSGKVQEKNKIFPPKVIQNKDNKKADDAVF